MEIAEKNISGDDRQATNAALAALAKDGNTFALGQLWELNRGLLNRLYWKWFDLHRERASGAGMELEDFEQEAFFAVRNAAKTYDPEKGKFSAYLDFAVMTQLNRSSCGDHGRCITREDGVQCRIPANPLNTADRLDDPLPGDDSGEATRMDLVADPEAEAPFEAVDQTSYQEALHSAIMEALEKLPDRQRKIIIGRYLDPQLSTQAELGNRLGVSCSYVQQQERQALRVLSRDPTLAAWHDDVIQTRAYQNAGFKSWETSGSVEEKIIDYLDSYGVYRDHYRSINAILEKQKAENTQLIAEAFGITIEDARAKIEEMNA